MSKIPLWYTVTGEARNDPWFEKTLRSELEDYLRYHHKGGWLLLKEQRLNNHSTLYAAIMVDAPTSRARYELQQKQYQELVAYLQKRLHKKQKMSVIVSIWGGPVGSLEEFLERNQQFTLIGMKER